MYEKITLATRKSPLAIAQAHLALDYLRAHFPQVEYKIMSMETTGDQKIHLPLPQIGGKGLFTQELENVLREGQATLAVHSAKDLPTENPNDLTIVGYLPREIANDMLVYRQGCDSPKKIATGSPRRQAQARMLFPNASEWVDIRGNVETRLRKIAQGEADATFLAVAGLKRLGIDSWPGLLFKQLPFDKMVPAAGQGAIALQCRTDEATSFSTCLDADTAHDVSIERLLLKLLGGGCHQAYGMHCNKNTLWVYYSQTGIQKLSLVGLKSDQIEPFLKDWLAHLNK